MLTTSTMVNSTAPAIRATMWSSSSGLRIDQGGKVTLYSGLLQWQARNAHSGDFRSWRLSHVSLQMVEADGKVVFDLDNGDSTLFVFEPRYRSLEGSLTFSSSGTTAHTVIVSVTKSLQQDVPAGPDIEYRFEIEQFESGELEVLAEDGSSLLLDAESVRPKRPISSSQRRMVPVLSWNGLGPYRRNS